MQESALSPPLSQPFFRNPAPLMQNYMIKSVKMTKKSIFREQFSWKVRNFAQNLCENGLHLGKEQALCTRFAPSLSHAFRKGCRSFCCSISHTNCDLERDLMSKSKCGALGFFRGRPTQTLHDSINKEFICMSGRIVVPLRHLI